MFNNDLQIALLNSGLITNKISLKIPTIKERICYYTNNSHKLKQSIKIKNQSHDVFINNPSNILSSYNQRLDPHHALGN